MSSVVSTLLTISHWNVEGLIRNGESKLKDRAFVEHIVQNDIICLSETHCDEEDVIDLHGFNCFKLCRKANQKNKRHFGGIAILYKQSLKEGIKFLSHKNDDYVWIKLVGKTLGLKKDCYICYAYIPPENSNYYKARGQDTLEYIESELPIYSNLGNVLLIGDINARTGIATDFVQHDENDSRISNLQYDADLSLPHRNSQDHKVCARGT